MIKGYKMSKAYIVTTAELTVEQIKELKHKHDVKEIINMNPELNRIWNNIDPEWNDSQLEEKIYPIIDWLRNNIVDYDVVVLDGDFTAIYKIISGIAGKLALPIIHTGKRFRVYMS
jgi:hypothetical protein